MSGAKGLGLDAEGGGDVDGPGYYSGRGSYIVANRANTVAGIRDWRCGAQRFELEILVLPACNPHGLWLRR